MISTFHAEKPVLPLEVSMTILPLKKSIRSQILIEACKGSKGGVEASAHPFFHGLASTGGDGILGEVPVNETKFRMSETVFL